MNRVLGVLVALLLVLTACGDDGPTSEEKAAASVGQGLQDNSAADAGSEPIITDDEADCAGAAIVERVGVDPLVEEKVLDEDLSLVGIPDRPSRKLAKAMIHGLSDCVGIVEYTVRTLRTLMRGMAAAAGSGKKFDDSDKKWKRILACAQRQIPEKTAKKAALRNPNETLLPRPLLNRLRKCDATLRG